MIFLAINRKKYASGRLDGTGATIIYTHQSKREQKNPHEKCKYYKEHCSNENAPRYLSPCYKTCPWWESDGSVAIQSSGSSHQGTTNNAQAPAYIHGGKNVEAGINRHEKIPSGSIKKCKYYTKKNGKCKNIKAQVYFNAQIHFCLYKCKYYTPK